MRKSLWTLTTILLAGSFLTLGCEKKDDTLHLLTWDGYIPQPILDKFTAETGIKVSVTDYSSTAEMLTKLQEADRPYDLIQPSDYMVGAMAKDGQLQPLNHAAIPNLKNLAPEFRAMPFDPDNQYSVPWMAGFVGIVYNAETVPEPIVGYRDVFTPEHAGHIVAVDDPREIVTWALAATDLPANEITDENLKKITPLLQDWISKVRIFDSNAPRAALRNGDVDLGVVWSGEGALLFRENPKFQWILPAEGFRMFVDNLAIPKNAKNAGYAEKFLNFILRPDVSKMISDDFPYYNPNAEARKLLSPEDLNNPASYPQGLDIHKAIIFTDLGVQSTKLENLINSLKSP